MAIIQSYEEKSQEMKLEDEIKELKQQLENMEKENEELKRQLKEKTDNQKNSLSLNLQLQHIHQFQINEPESTRSFTKIDQKANSENLEHLTNKYEIMKVLNHLNVLKTESQTINDKSHQLSFLNEHCPISLEEAVKEKKLSKVQQVFSIYQIAEGMKYIHSQRVVHQNLKPSSIQISFDGTIKIGGFEKSFIIKSEHPSKEEQIMKMSDVFSFGDIVYFILSGGETAEIKNVSALTSFLLLAQQLIDACWNAEPNNRPSFETICDVLEKNQLNLASLSQQEIQEVSQMISQYKRQFSF